MISFEFAVFTNFIFSYYWIWHNRTTNKNFSNFVKHFFAFNLSSILGFLVKMLFLLLFEKTFGWSPVLCNFAALTISGLVNFTLSECIVFKKRPIIIPIKKKFKIKGFNNGFIKR
jgi:putative flippase GtrA